MKYLNLFLSAALAAGVLSSCGTDDPAKKLLNVRFDNQFAFVTTENNDTLVTPLEGDITISFDGDNDKADLRISGLTLANNADGVSVSLNDIHCTTDKDGNRVAEAQLDGSQAGVSAVKLCFFPEPGAEKEGEDSHAGLYLSLTMNDGTRATLFPYRCYGYGTTETVNTSAGNSKFISTKTYYIVDLNPEAMAATMTMCKASFAENMPALGDMVLHNSTETPSATSSISLQLSHEGYSFSAPMIVPTIADVPQPRRAITNLNASAQGNQNRLELSFNCMGVFNVNVEATAFDMINPYLEDTYAE